MIIGISGYATAGKTTLASYLVKDYGFTRVAFGDLLKEHLMYIFGFTREQLYDTKKKFEIDPRYNKSPREIMQYYGTEFMRNTIRQDFWVWRMGEKLDPMLGAEGIDVVIDDVRFEDEAALVRGYARIFGGGVVHLQRLGVGRVSTHSSENLPEIFAEDVVFHANPITSEGVYPGVDSLVNGFRGWGN